MYVSKGVPTSHIFLWILSQMNGWRVSFSRQQYLGKNALQVNKAMLLTLRKRSLTFVIVFMKEPFFYSNTTFVRFTSLLLRATITSENVRLSARCRAGPIMSIIVPRGASLGTHPLSRRVPRTGSTE